MKIIFVLILYMLFFVNHQSGYSLSNSRIGIGISTIEIIGGNIAAKPFVYEVSKNNFIFGGSFDQAQPGFRIDLVEDIDEKGRFQLPIGFEYHFLMGREKQPISAISNIYLRHDQNIMAITLGLNYVFWQFLLLENVTKFYVGLDTRTTLIKQGKYEEEWQYTRLETRDLINIDTKSSTVRLGGNGYFGFSGDITDKAEIDVKLGLGLLNLLFRNNDRGELFTINKKYSYEEQQESLVYTFNFNMMLRYKL